MLLAEESAYQGSTHHETDRALMLERLAGAEERQSLSEGVAGASPRALRLRTDLPAGLTGALTAAGHWPAVIAAATAVYHSRMLSVGDVVLGIPVAARRTPAALATPAMLANDLPLRLTVGPDTTFAELVRAVRAELGTLLRAQRLRREELHEARELTGTDAALFGTAVNAMSFDARVRFGDALLTPRQLSNGPVADLAMATYGDPASGEVVLELAANPALYTEDELRSHQERFLRLLGSLADAPDAPVGRAALLDAETSELLLHAPTVRRAMFRALWSTSSSGGPPRCPTPLLCAPTRPSPTRNSTPAPTGSPACSPIVARAPSAWSGWRCRVPPV
ncbi:hypothetical protein HFP43_19505 [Streptomyces sp. SJ1-7]|nr:hypothetical protein [Streptomyces sp. SJ1-7]